MFNVNVNKITLNDFKVINTEGKSLFKQSVITNEFLNGELNSMFLTKNANYLKDVKIQHNSFDGKCHSVLALNFFAIKSLSNICYQSQNTNITENEMNVLHKIFQLHQNIL